MVLCDDLEGWDGMGVEEAQKVCVGGNIYAYSWFTLLYRRDWHSTVEQLYANFKKDIYSVSKQSAEQ